MSSRHRQQNTPPHLLNLSIRQSQAVNYLGSIRHHTTTIEPRPDRMNSLIRAINPQAQLRSISIRDR
jgi:hypothetical protein